MDAWVTLVEVYKPMMDRRKLFAGLLADCGVSNVSHGERSG